MYINQNNIVLIYLYQNFQTYKLHKPNILWNQIWKYWTVKLEFELKSTWIKLVLNLFKPNLFLNSNKLDLNSIPYATKHS